MLHWKWWILIMIASGIFIFTIIFGQIYNVDAHIDEGEKKKVKIAVIVNVFLFICYIIGSICLIHNKRISYVNWYNSEYSEIYANEIHSIDRASESDGIFLLGCGFVSSEQYYFYYTKTAENTFEMSKIKCKDTYIVETKDAKYYITKNKDAKSSKVFYTMMVPKGTAIHFMND